jgi:hypothetical protein
MESAQGKGQGNNLFPVEQMLLTSAVDLVDGIPLGEASLSRLSLSPLPISTFERLLHGLFLEVIMHVFQLQ